MTPLDWFLIARCTLLAGAAIFVLANFWLFGAALFERITTDEWIPYAHAVAVRF